MEDDDAMNDESRFRRVGGTPGGIGEFCLGFAMAVAGAYLITNRVMVATGFWSMWGYSMFGLSLVPLMIGIGILFFNGKSIIGWLHWNSDYLHGDSNESSHLLSANHSVQYDRNDCAPRWRHWIDLPRTHSSRTS